MTYISTNNDEGLRKSLIASAIFHIVALLFIYFGLPHLMPPLPEHHDPVPLTIIEIADMTNTRVKEEEPTQEPPKPEPPKPEPPKPEEKMAPPPPPAPPVPAEKPPEPKVEALKAASIPKPKPPEVKPQPEDFSKLLKNLESKKEQPVKAVPQKQPVVQATPAPSHVASLSTRLTMSEEDALRRQISMCWNAPVGSRNAEQLIVELIIDVNTDRTVMNAEIVDKSRYASDSFFRAAADSAVRAVRNPRCSPLELPVDKYDQWKRIDFTFDPRDML